MKRYIIIPLLLLVVACAGMSTGQQMAQSCSAWGSLTFIAADMVTAGRLNDSQIARFQALRPSVKMLCSIDTPTDLDVQSMRRALRTANGMGIKQ